MKFPAHVNLVVVGVDNYQPEGIELGLIETSDGFSLTEAKLEYGKKSYDVARDLIKKYIDITSFKRHLLVLSPVRFVDGPDRYPDALLQDIALIYKVIIPLNACLKNEMQWIPLDQNIQNKTFCKDHLNIINIALQNG